MAALVFFFGTCFTALGRISFEGAGTARPDPRGGREQIVRTLSEIPGRHVVFVRYGDHSFYDEWVFNSADIDASRIIWCRAMGPSQDAEVARYYKDRALWLLELDRGVPPQLSRYDPRLDQGSQLQSVGYVPK